MTVVAAFLAFVVTVVFMFVLRPVAVAVGLVDVPGGRKRHDDIVPIIGGIAMSIGLGFGTSLGPQPAFFTPTLLAIYLLVVVGSIDDRFDLPANVRLVAQLCAALLVVLVSDAQVTSLGALFAIDAHLGVLAIPFSVLFVVTLINAFNLIDGIDGLAGGLALMSLTAMMVIGIGTPAFALTAIGVAIVAAFLLFNFPLGFNRSVRTFMGDAGSTSLGLLIATLGVQLSQGPVPKIAPVVGLWLVAVPVFDLFCTITRRLVEGKSPFAPDHEHLHHVLTDGGVSRRCTLGFMLALAFAFASIGILGEMLGVSDGVMLSLWLAAGVLYYQLMRHPGVIIRLYSSYGRAEHVPYTSGGSDHRRR